MSTNALEVPDGSRMICLLVKESDADRICNGLLHRDRVTITSSKVLSWSNADPELIFWADDDDPDLADIAASFGLPVRG